MDFDDNYTNVDDHRAEPAPRRTPRMLAAETVMPTVSYRTPVGPASTPRTVPPRTVTPRAASPTPSAAMPRTAYRVPAPAAAPASTRHDPTDAVRAAAPPRHTPPDGVRAQHTQRNGVHAQHTQRDDVHAQHTPPHGVRAQHTPRDGVRTVDAAPEHEASRAPRTPTESPRAFASPDASRAAATPRHTPADSVRAQHTPRDGVRTIDAASEVETYRAPRTPPDGVRAQHPPNGGASPGHITPIPAWALAGAQSTPSDCVRTVDAAPVELAPETFETTSRAPRTPTAPTRAYASPVELAPETFETTSRTPAPPRVPNAAARRMAPLVEADPELSVVEMMPRAPRAPNASARHAAPSVEADPELSVVEMMPRAPRATAAPAPIAQATPRGELTVVFGCRGGAGSTTLAVNTAAALARAGRSVCIVDLDLQLGDVCVALDLDPQTSLAAVAREAHMLDATSLRRRLAQHGSGVCALTQTGHVDELDAGLSARLPNLLDTLRMHFDHVIVDGVRDFGDVALAALEAATRILVVVTQDVPAVRRAARVLNLLGRLSIEESRCALVINRAARRAAIDDAAIERALGIKIAARVRDDAKVAEALDAGALLIDIARSRPIVEDVARVANLCKGGV